MPKRGFAEVLVCEACGYCMPADNLLKRRFLLRRCGACRRGLIKLRVVRRGAAREQLQFDSDWLAAQLSKRLDNGKARA